MLRRNLLKYITKTVIKEEELGTPSVVIDSYGDVIAYESTEEYTIENNESIDTGFIVFNGKDWSMHLHAKFSYWENNTVEYPTILNAMEEVEPYYGFIIRYEGSQLYFVERTNHWTLTADNNDEIDVYITYRDGTVTLINNSNIIATFNIEYHIDKLTFVIGSSIDSEGNPWRHANCIIYEFKVNRE